MHHLSHVLHWDALIISMYLCRQGEDWRHTYMKVLCPCTSTYKTANGIRWWMV